MVELDKTNFEAEVLQSKGLTLVDFWSESCEPCKALMPKVHELAEEYAAKVKFCSLDITKARRVAIGQKVMGLPTIILYKDGEKVAEVTKDTANIEAIRAMIDENVAEA
ncbi:thioredoxin TrxA [Guggenheimella bovis]